MERLLFSKKTANLPSVSYFQILLLGWSVKKIFPYLSTAGPSVKENCFEINCKVAFFATSPLDCPIDEFRVKKENIRMVKRRRVLTKVNFMAMDY